MNKLITYRMAFAYGVAAIALTAPISAGAQQVLTTIRIPAGPMSSSLTELGRRTGLNILFSPDAVHGLRSQAVNARVAPEQAVRIMLQDSPLDVLKHSTGTIIIRRRGAGAGGQPAAINSATTGYNAEKRHPRTQLASLNTQTGLDASISSEERGGALEEIVVTAKRRSENQQDVPIAISTVTGDALGKMGVATTEALGVAIPALQFGRQAGNGGTPFLRGVGTPTAAAAVESPVAVYVDDVYIAAPSGTLQRFFAIENIAVLKGPQGTLFGRNATGGVVQIQTKNPSHDAALDLTAGYGNYDTVSGSLYATAGLSETIAVNLAASGEHQDRGYGRSIATGKDVWKSWDYALRGKLLWEPSKDTSLLLNADYSRRRSDIGMNFVPFPGTVALGGATYQSRYATYASPGDFSNNETYGTSAKLQHDFGAATLVGISAYRNVAQNILIDVDGSLPGAPVIVQATTNVATRTFSQEIQLLSPSGDKFNWIIGAFYFNQHATIDPVRNVGAAFTPFGGALEIVAKTVLNSYSGFGEISYEILPKLEITGGLRYTSDKFDYTGARFNAAGAILPPGQVNTGDTFSKFTYRGIVSYEADEDIMLYGSYSRGFKSGGYTIGQPIKLQAGVPVVNSPVLPEVLDAYEVGFKSEILDRQVRINASVFHYDYSNMQVPIIVTGQLVNINAAKSRMNGADIDLTYAPTRRFTLTVGAAFLDSKFVRFQNGPLNVPNPAVCVPVPMTTGPLTGGNTNCAADLRGRRTARSPKFTGAIGATYRIPTDVGNFSMDATLSHNSGYFWEPDNRVTQPSFDILNASLTWLSMNGRYEIKVFARNILDEFYYTAALESTNYDAFSPAMPRSYGFSLAAHF